MEKQLMSVVFTCTSSVLLVKDVIENENPGILKVVVDSPASKENVTRFLQSKGYMVNAYKIGDNYELVATYDPAKLGADAGKGLQGIEEAA